MPCTKDPGREPVYPLNCPSAYPRSQWYIAGYGFEFGPQVIARRILGDPLVFYRTADGEPVALWGLCAHRFMPLAQGRIENDSVVCPYHAYAYGSDGRCHTIPTGGTPSPHARLRRYLLVERGPLVWIWMGEPDQVDLSLLPDASDIGLGENSAGWRVDPACTFPMRARAALLIDNLFDLSHLAFIHAESIPGGGPISMVHPLIETEGGRLRVSRTIAGMVLDEESLFSRSIPVAKDRGNMHALLYSEMYNPGLINASGPWLWESRDDGTRGERIARLNFVHGVTPETDSSTHYFGIMTRDYMLDDDQLSAFLVWQTDRVREEDVRILEALEVEIDSHASTRKELSTKVDEGALKARRLLRKAIEAETLDAAGDGGAAITA